MNRPASRFQAIVMLSVSSLFGLFGGLVLIGLLREHSAPSHFSWSAIFESRWIIAGYLMLIGYTWLATGHGWGARGIWVASTLYNLKVIAIFSTEYITKDSWLVFAIWPACAAGLGVRGFWLEHRETSGIRGVPRHS